VTLVVETAGPTWRDRVVGPLSRAQSWLTWARAGCLLFAVALPVGKAIQVSGGRGTEIWRQGILIATGVALVLAVAGPRGVTTWQAALPGQPWPANGGQLHRLTLGALGPLLCGTSVVAYIDGRSQFTILLIAGFGFLAVVLLTCHEWSRRALVPRPDRAVLWAVAPATLWWVVILFYGAMRSDRFNGTLGDFEVLADGAAGKALGTVIVIGFGEELLFRGLLLVAAGRAKLSGCGYVIVSVSFGAWHVPDALSEGWVITVGTFVAMTAVSQLVLVPLRLRSRTLAGPALLHAANNLAFRLL
jgi:membrane protease YdiL (CAAX protease family)